MTATTSLGIQLAQRAVTGVDEPWSPAQWEALSHTELVETHRDLAAARRRLDAEFAAASAQIAKLSDPADGPEGIARRHGFSTPTQMIASVTGGSTGEAGRMVAVGKVTREADAPPTDDAGAGQRPAPRFPVLAKSVTAGELSMDSAAAITAMLERVSGKADPEALSRAEGHLVKRAKHLPYSKVCALLRQCEARFDLEANAQREEMRRQDRYLKIFENRGGMVVVDGRLDPETAAPLRAAIDGIVSDFLRQRRNREPIAGCEEVGLEPDAASDAAQDATGTTTSHAPGGAGPHGPADDRSVAQVRADALADLARHCLGCEAENLPLAKTTVVVRVGLEELRSGVGLGEIDGCDQPMTVSTIRRMAADAEVIPAVMGGNGEVLEFGRSRRLFSRAQRLALVERDGGCAYCHAPPSFTEAHHIKWWWRDDGRTDLSNGILLCTSCHHRIHRDKWGITVRDGTVEFIPPSTVDRQRRPVTGGRTKFEYTQRDHRQVTGPVAGQVTGKSRTMGQSHEAAQESRTAKVQPQAAGEQPEFAGNAHLAKRARMRPPEFAQVP